MHPGPGIGGRQNFVLQRLGLVFGGVEKSKGGRTIRGGIVFPFMT